ncbi:hypothetical protein [Brevundimonas sp.]
MPYILTAGAVWLGWQIVLQPIIQRAPPELAVRIAPGSPTVLRRAAEARQVAADRTGQTPDTVSRANEDSGVLGREALSRAPFDARALRVIGLSEARAGREAQADELLTLAGNWSLRDDPAHVWLVDYRLRRGDYVSSFAHADTLARRRQAMRPGIFRLFTTAATVDTQRALPVIARLISENPSWRKDYLDSLYGTTEGLRVAVNLAVVLQAGKAPLTNAELRQLYLYLLDRGVLDGARTVRERLNRPDMKFGVANGSFDDPSSPEPFQWRIAQGAGIVAEILEDDVRAGDPALRASFDGYTEETIAEQLMFLSPGRYRLVYEARTESGDPARHMTWTVVCAPGNRRILNAPSAPADAEVWTAGSVEFTVQPDCSGQWLQLRSVPDQKRATTVVWFDRVAVSRTVP